jgi:predicted nucleic acid-binding protein
VKRYVLDSFVVIAFFEDEPGAALVEQVLREIISRKAHAWMSVVNWGEVFYSTYREQGQHAANQVLQQLESYPIEIVPADKELTQEAALLKGRHRIAYADCFAAALAKKEKATLITGDPEFRMLEDEVDILWLSR